MEFNWLTSGLVRPCCHVSAFRDLWTRIIFSPGKNGGIEIQQVFVAYLEALNSCPSMERMERQRRNPPSRSIAPSDSAGSSSSASRRSYSNRNRNSDYKYSKHNTNSNRSYEDDSDWRSRRSSDSKSYVQKLEPKEDGVGYGGISHSDLPPVLVGTCPSMCPGKCWNYPLLPASSSLFFFLSGSSTLFSFKIVEKYVFLWRDYWTIKSLSNHLLFVYITSPFLLPLLYDMTSTDYHACSILIDSPDCLGFVLIFTPVIDAYMTWNWMLASSSSLF